MDVETEDYTEEVFFEVSPQEVYEALMDSSKHEAFTGAEADISIKVGGLISAWDGYITGENVELVPDEKIVQKWRTTDWPKGHYSTVTFELEDTDDGGTKLIFAQEDIPVEHFDDIKKGWTENYWDPMKEYFSSN